MSDTGEGPKFQVDADWKTQAQKEKERLAEQERKSSAKTTPGAGGAAGHSPAGAAAAAGRDAGEMPPANWDTLIAMMATQAIMYLGGMQDPRSGQPMVDLDVARHQIDLLSVLEEKTKGNLSDDESRQLKLILHDLRMRYVQVAQSTNPIVAEALRGSSGAGANSGLGS